MESKNLNNCILAEELVQWPCWRTGQCGSPVRMGPLTYSKSGMERSSIGSYCEQASRTVLAISEKNITGTKQVIDDAAARFWAKRGLQDPSKSRISYGRNVKR